MRPRIRGWMIRAIWNVLTKYINKNGACPQEEWIADRGWRHGTGGGAAADGG